MQHQPGSVAAAVRRVRDFAPREREMRNLRRGWARASIAGRRRPWQVVRIALAAVLRGRSAAADMEAAADSALLCKGRRMRKNGATSSDERAASPDSP